MRFALARALDARADTRPRAIRLATEARGLLNQQPRRAAKRIRQVDQWLAARRPPVAMPGASPP
jgi:hypothetical protein